MNMPDTNQPPLAFWEELYQNKSVTGTGKPTAVLEHYVADRQPGAALELGCARGDDAIWLATQGWTVTAVDISTTALEYAKYNAAQKGVNDQISFEQHDLAKTFPRLKCDLVSAMFLQTPLDFPSSKVFKQASTTLNSGGLLLITTHGTTAPWSWKVPHKPQLKAREILNEIELDGARWTEIFAGSTKREVIGPEKQTAIIADEVIAIEKR